MSAFRQLVLFTAAALFVACSSSSFAKTFKELFPKIEYKNEKAQAFVDSLDYKQGEVSLTEAGVKFKVPAEFYFLNAEDSKKLIVKVWGNPPESAEDTLGMILPADKTPIDDTWGAIISFENDGYVSDENAESIDYGELLSTMQDSTEAANEERKKAGYEEIKLVGWASPPFYDKASHKLHWAKELEFGGQQPHTLNYDVRALGRHGVLKMNFVSDMGQLNDIKTIIPSVMAMPEFVEGSRYKDYVPGADKVAAYGIGGLIAGKVLAKTGLLAILIAFLKKGWVLIVFALAAIGGWLAKLFRGGSKTGV